MDDYLQLYWNSSYITQSPLNLALISALALTRLIPIVDLAPFLGSKVMNRPAKVMLAVLLYLVFLPKILSLSTIPLAFDIRFIFLFVKEFFIGTSIGLLAAMPFFMAESAGVIIDHQRGASSLMINDPIIQTQNSPIGVLFNAIGVVLFFWIGGPFIFFDALLYSFEVIPPDLGLHKLFFAKGTPFFMETIHLINTELHVALQLAAPSLIVILMTDMFLGLANRLAPQIMITFLGLPLKAFLGLAILWVAWFVVMKEFTIQYHIWLDKTHDMISFLRTGW